MEEINLYEFLGIIIGDGCLLYYPEHRVYGLEITGNATEEQDYYLKIKNFITKEFNLNSRVYVRKMKNGTGLKLVVYSKKLAEKMMTYGITKNKTFTITIHDSLLSWEKSKFILKGIFETDGCLYFSKSKPLIGKPSYPRLEIKTASLALANQMVSILKENCFNPHDHQNGTTRVIYLSGKEMLEKWIQEIGFSSLKNKTKYLLWKELGYYIPKISLPERISHLSNKHQKII